MALLRAVAGARSLSSSNNIPELALKATSPATWPPIVRVGTPGGPAPACSDCGRVLYSNPKPVGGVVVSEVDSQSGERRVLLLRRGIRPRQGSWGLPGGYLESFESTDAGAAREALEEAQARVRIISLLAVYSVPRADQIMLTFRAVFAGAVSEPRFAAGHETTEARMFAVTSIPWGELAFPTTRFALEDFARDPDGVTVSYRVVTEGLPPDGADLPRGT